MRSVAVFCGSSLGSNTLYADAAASMAAELVKSNIAVVYGGASVGTMGVVADSALRLGGEVTGVITQGLLDREIGHDMLSELHIVETMHERKVLMAELSDGFVVLPGGMGTIDELSEMFTWNHLGIHHKPIGLLNVNNYFDDLLSFLDNAVDDGFMSSKSRNELLVTDMPGELINKMQAWTI